MTPTEELRAKLDELGVEYTANDEKHVKETCWPYMGELMAVFAEYDNGTTRFACDTWCFTHEQAIAATVEPNKTTVKKDGECQYCHRRMDKRKSVRTMNHEAWVNVEYGTLDIAVYGHEGFVPITHCPWCGREL